MIRVCWANTMSKNENGNRQNWNGIIYAGVILIASLAVLRFYQIQRRKHRLGKELELGKITYWKRYLQDSNLDITLVECANGLQILDEADGAGNGIITLFHAPGKSLSTKKCYSLIKRSAELFNRKDLQPIKIDCVKKFSVVRSDFDQVIGQTITVPKRFSSDFFNLVSYLKTIQIIRE